MIFNCCNDCNLNICPPLLLLNNSKSYLDNFFKTTLSCVQFCHTSVGLEITYDHF